MTARPLAKTREVSAAGAPAALSSDPIRVEIARLGDLDRDALRLRIVLKALREADESPDAGRRSCAVNKRPGLESRLR
jgi:hypothetical protein